MYIFPKLVIVCEGETDRFIIAHLAQRVLKEHGIDRVIEVIPAHGIAIVPRMVRAIETRHVPPAMGVIVDSDGHPGRVWNLFRKQLSWSRYSLVIAEPTLESWLLDSGSLKASRGELVQRAGAIPLSLIETLHPDFGDFKQLILAPPGVVIHSRWIKTV